MNALADWIRDEICTGVPMRLDRFMELALYHREYGYYTRPRRIGREGDFFTSVSVGPLFGRLLAWQAREMAQRLAEPEFWIVEQGAHDGQLACDILKETVRWPEFDEKVRYLVVEPSAAGREVQRQTLAQYERKVTWIGSLEEWEGAKPAGVFLSNELVDAMPVRLAEWRQGTWHECGVGLEGEAFVWALLPVTDAILLAKLKAFPMPIPEGSRLEIGLAAEAWMGGVAAFLRRGYVLTLDYGLSERDGDAARRLAGTLTSYRQHRRSENVLDVPGEQDITSHVDFDALICVAEQAGWTTLGLVDQQRFLTGILQGRGGELNAKEVRAFQTLTHPGHLGMRFKALIQAKAAPANLSGLHFARSG